MITPMRRVTPSLDHSCCVCVQVTSCSFNPEGTKVVSGSGDKTVRIWNLESGEEEKQMTGHTDTVRNATCMA